MRGKLRNIIRMALVLGVGLLPALAGSLSPEVANLGDRLNSKGSDFAPIVSPDGKYLFFASDRDGGYGGQDIWVSQRENGVWQKPQNLGPPINDARNQGPDCFVTDGNTQHLYMTYCQPADQGLCDIYMSRKVGEAWGPPENLGAPINTKYSDANATWDYVNQVLYFASTRPGGFEGSGPRRVAGEASYDIWTSAKKSDGSWSEPLPLRSPVNTPGWEGVAFYHTADKYLYFSSDGHGGQGGADIFRSRELSPGKWSEPEPMDLVNSPDNDMYFSIPASGEVAYFSSNTSGTFGIEDIYQVPLNLVLSPEVLAQRTMQIPVTQRVQAGPAAGHFETIYFDFDKSDLRESEVEKLAKLIEFMNQYPELKIEVTGHACSVGRPDYNLVLSKERAESVYKYLLQHGVSAERMTVTYYGESRPAEANDPSRGNPLNRRVEISIK